ncbi:MAG: ATPase, T2SS/T4P/T4SS family [Kiritimatiellia bacterium]
MKLPIELVIQRPGKPDTVITPEAGVYTIGSSEDNTIVLRGEQIAWRHAVLGLSADTFWLEALQSNTGTQVDGQRITGRVSLKPGQAVGLGGYRILIRGQAAPPPPEQPAPSPLPLFSPGYAPPMDPESKPDPLEQVSRQVRKQLHAELLNRLDIKRLTSNQIGEQALRERALSTIQQITQDIRQRLPKGIDPETLAKELYDEAVGLGPLEDLLSDPNVTEIMVNGADSVYVERRGKLYLTHRTFLNDDSVLAIIERIVSPIGRRIDESQPYVDARLPDGSRVNAIIPPLSLSGPCLTIRKFSKIPLTVQDLVGFDSLTAPMAAFLQACVVLRKNVVVSGGTGSGKTTFLNVLSSFLPNDERIVTIEDAAELRLMQRHVIRLEARPPNIEGRGAVAIRDLVRNALRMRPDRIVVGECRGGEALDMLQAMNTGHDGSLTTVHANSPRDVISRLETMVMMSGMDLPLRAINEQVAAALHLIVHTARFADGSRKVSKITEVCGMEGDQITMQDIFEYKQTGVGEKGLVQGRFVPTGSVPTFVEQMNARGINLNRRIFDPNA